MWRNLTEAELKLMMTMLSAVDSKQGVISQLTSARVREMNDGAMGSLRFEGAGNKSRRFGETISQAKFVDEDGVAASVAINLDQDGNLYELDIWKVDFSSLKRWPNADEIVVQEKT